MKLSFVKNQSNLQIFSKNEQNIRYVIPFNKMDLLVIIWGQFGRKMCVYIGSIVVFYPLWSIYSKSSHVRFLARLPEIILYVYVRKMIQANFDWIWSNGFREEFSYNLCWMTKDDKWWQKLTWPKWSGELKIKVNDDRRQVRVKGHLLFGQLR